ncbi:hypothetical protein L1887_22832 [Cichorium endivia]|nr:hypothetical protein L1887_22832 [Cichorium endivia]
MLGRPRLDYMTSTPVEILHEKFQGPNAFSRAFVSSSWIFRSTQSLLLYIYTQITYLFLYVHLNSTRQDIL